MAELNPTALDALQAHSMVLGVIVATLVQRGVIPAAELINAIDTASTHLTHAQKELLAPAKAELAKLRPHQL